jgi:hypothetical protein
VPTRRTVLRASALAAIGSLAGCAGSGVDGGSSPTAAPTSSAGPGPGTAALGAPTLASSAFEDAEPIPTEFTCSGVGRSPPLSASAVPAEAETLALVMDDPDAGGRPYVHWLVWDVPADRTEWPAGVPEGETVAELGGAVQGQNSRGTVGYVGPCPPPDDGPHTYRFALYALDSPIGLDPGAERPAVEDAIAGTRYGVTVLRGTFER